MKYSELCGIASEIRDKVSDIRGKLGDLICNFLSEYGGWFSFGEHSIWLCSQWYGSETLGEQVRLTGISRSWDGVLCFFVQTKKKPITVEDFVQPAGKKKNCTPTEKDKLYNDTRNLNDFGIETLLKIVHHLGYMALNFPEENKKIERP